MRLKRINRTVILRLVSIIVSLMLTCCLMPFNMAATSGTENFARNPGFENGTDSEVFDWGLYPSWKSVNITTNTVHSGSRAVKVELSETQNYALFAGGYRSEHFELGAAMTVEMWVKYENLTGGFFFGLERKKNDTAVANAMSETYIGTSDGWQKISFDVPQTDTALSEDIIKVEINRGSGTLYIDDVTLSYKKEDSPKEYILNGSFEDGSAAEATAWGLSGGWNNGNFTSDAYDGNRAVKIELGTVDVNLFQSSAWNPEKYNLSSAKVITAMVKYENVTGMGVYLKVERKRNGTAAADVSGIATAVVGTSDGWVKLELTVEETDKAIDELIISVSSGAGSGTVYVDSVSMTDCSDDTPAVDPDPEPEEPDISKEYLMNSSFEEGTASEATAWGLSSGWNNGRFTSDAHDGNRAIKLQLNSSDSNLFQSSAWNSEKYNLSSAKIITAMVKYENVVGAGVYLKAERKKNDTGVANVTGGALTGSSDGYIKLELIVEKTSYELDEFIVSVVGGAGSGTVYIDSVSMKDYVPEEPSDPENPDPDKPEKPQTNYLLNGSFENGGSASVDFWGIVGEWNASYISSDAHDGVRSIKLTAGDSERSFFQSNMWNDAFEYDLSSGKLIEAWVKTDNLKGAGVSIRVERKRNDVAVANAEGAALTDTKGEWKKISLVLAAAEEEIDELIVFVVCGAGSGTVYVDSISMNDYTPTDEEINDLQALEDKNLLMNGSFEKGSADEAEGWGLGDGWKSGAISNDARTGGRAVAINPGEISVNLFQSSAWNTKKIDAKSAKRISAWVKYADVIGTGIFLLAERKADDRTFSSVSSTAVNGSSDGWVQLELIVPAAEKEAEEFLVSVVVASGSGRVLVDDVFMEEYYGNTDGIEQSVYDDGAALLRNGGVEVLNSDGSVYCWDVWPGDPSEGEKHASVSTEEKHGGKQSLCVSLTPKNVQAVYQYTLSEDNRFEFNEAYVFSAWIKCKDISLEAGNKITIGVKRKGTDGNYYNLYNEITAFSEEWQPVRIVAPKALVKIAQYDVIIDLGAGTGDFYMDDFLLVPATQEDLASLGGIASDGIEKLSAKTALLSTEEVKSEGVSIPLVAVTCVTAILTVAAVSAAAVLGIKLRRSK